MDFVYFGNLLPCLAIAIMDFFCFDIIDLLVSAYRAFTPNFQQGCAEGKSVLAFQNGVAETHTGVCQILDSAHLYILAQR